MFRTVGISEQRYFLKFSVRTQSTTSFNLKGVVMKWIQVKKKKLLIWLPFTHTQTFRGVQRNTNLISWKEILRLRDSSLGMFWSSTSFDPRCLRRRIPQMRRLALVKPAAAASRLFQYKSHDKCGENIALGEGDNCWEGTIRPQSTPDQNLF